MHNLVDVVWIELRKAQRSSLPFFTVLGSLFMPAGMGFLIFLAKNPELSHKLGLVGAKANLTAYYATNWSSFLVLFAEIIAAGGFFLFVMVTSWVFGREFADRTLKDMLAVPVARAIILLAKFIVVAVWSAGLTVVILVSGLLMGLLLQLPDGSPSIIFQGGVTVVISACLVIFSVLPFAWFASVGRGYLLPMGMAVLLLIMGNMVMVAGWGDYFPWAVAALYAQGTSSLTFASYAVVCFTGLLGLLGTYFWWKYADQNR